VPKALPGVFESFAFNGFAPQTERDPS